MTSPDAIRARQNDNRLSDWTRRTQRPLRVVVVDDHQMVLDELRAMLATYSDQVEIVGEGRVSDRLRR